MRGRLMQPPKRKKYNLTLLEISVAFFLLGILLSSLWGLYQSWLTTYQKNQKSQTQIQKLLFIHQRLDKLARLVSTPPPIEEEKNYLFTPEERIEGFETLCFSYYNAPDLDPSFNGRVRSLLFLNAQKELCLTTWSREKTPRTDILLKPVQGWALSYFNPQTNSWRDDWPGSFSHLPLWILCKIEGEEPFEIRLKIERSFEPILYLDKVQEVRATL